MARNEETLAEGEANADTILNMLGHMVLLAENGIEDDLFVELDHPQYGTLRLRASRQ